MITHDEIWKIVNQDTVSTGKGIPILKRLLPYKIRTPINKYLLQQEEKDIEHEQLCKDIARYFELSIFSLKQLSESQTREYWELRSKLSKVKP